MRYYWQDMLGFLKGLGNVALVLAVGIIGPFVIYLFWLALSFVLNAVEWVLS